MPKLLQTPSFISSPLFFQFEECSSAHEELSEKERRRMKDCFERYRRSGRIPPPPPPPSRAPFPSGSVSRIPVSRKRALRRAPAGRRPEADWEPSTGSDNTDTEGS